MHLNRLLALFAAVVIFGIVANRADASIIRVDAAVAVVGLADNDAPEGQGSHIESSGRLLGTDLEDWPTAGSSPIVAILHQRTEVRLASPSAFARDYRVLLLDGIPLGLMRPPQNCSRTDVVCT